MNEGDRDEDRAPVLSAAGPSDLSTNPDRDLRTFNERTQLNRA